MYSLVVSVGFVKTGFCSRDFMTIITVLGRVLDAVFPFNPGAEIPEGPSRGDVYYATSLPRHPAKASFSSLQSYQNLFSFRHQLILLPVYCMTLLNLGYKSSFYHTLVNVK